MCGPVLNRILDKLQRKIGGFADLYHMTPASAIVSPGTVDEFDHNDTSRDPCVLPLSAGQFVNAICQLFCYSPLLRLRGSAYGDVGETHFDELLPSQGESTRVYAGGGTAASCTPPPRSLPRTLGVEDEHRPLAKCASSPSTPMPAHAGGSSVAGYVAAALLWASGAAHPAQLVVAPRGPTALPPSRRAHILVQPVPRRSRGLSAPLQPTPQHLLRLWEGAPRPTGVLSLPHSLAERNFAPMRADGAQQPRPRSGVSKWPVQDKEATFKESMVLGVTAEEACDIAGAALGQWEAVQAISTIVVLQSAPKAHCSVEHLLRALHLSRANVEVQGGIVHCQPLTHRGPWVFSIAGKVDPAQPGHTLRIWWRGAA